MNNILYKRGFLMSIQRLQQKIREKKTPLALGLAAEPEQTGETLYESGVKILDAAADLLPAVYLRA